MRKTRKILAAALVLALALCLTACGGGLTRSMPLTLEQKLTQAEEKMNELNSMRMEMTMTMTAEITVAGQSQSMDVDVHYLMDIQKEPLLMKMDMEMSAMGIRQTAQYYAEQDGDQVLAYVSQNGGGWTRIEAGSLEEIAPSQDSGEQLNLFLACAGSFTETGKETINGAQVTVYSGVISGDSVKTAIQNSGSLESFASLLGGQVSEDMLADLGSIPATISLDDETGYLVRYSMDMTEVMQTLMEKVLGQLFAQYGLGSMEYSLTITRMEAEVNLSDFNQVGAIEIPEAAKAA